jgi:hypothetical protein
MVRLINYYLTPSCLANYLNSDVWGSLLLSWTTLTKGKWDWVLVNGDLDFLDLTRPSS